MPSTVTVAASPRDIRVFAITKRTGYSKTRARKIPMNTMRNVSPIARNATASPTRARTSEHRAHREQKLDAPRRFGSLHGLEGYGAVRLDRLRRLALAARTRERRKS